METSSIRDLSDHHGRLATILWCVGAATWEWNVQTGEVRFDDRWAEIVGCTLEELQPVSYDTWAGRVHPEDVERTEEALQAHCRGDAEFYSVEYRMRHKDERWVWISARGRIYRWDESGKALWMAGTQLDITEQKALELERAELSVRLEQAKKFAGLSLMAGGVAHKFSNLLTAILGSLEFAKELAPLPPETEALIEQARESARHASQLTNQMLIYSGRTVLQTTCIPSVLALFTERHQELESLLPEGSNLLMNLDQAGVAVPGDLELLFQTIFQLIQNASEALTTPGSSVRLSARLQSIEQASLEELTNGEMLSPGEYLVLEVSDQGEGMTQEMIGRAFDPFFSTRAAGRGLGLSLVLGAARSNGWGIKIDSCPGQGTKVGLYLPTMADE